MQLSIYRLQAGNPRLLYPRVLSQCRLASGLPSVTRVVPSGVLCAQPDERTGDWWDWHRERAAAAARLTPSPIPSPSTSGRDLAGRQGAERPSPVASTNGSSKRGSSSSGGSSAMADGNAGAEAESAAASAAGLDRAASPASGSGLPSRSGGEVVQRQQGEPAEPETLLLGISTRGGKVGSTYTGFAQGVEGLRTPCLHT